jgi:xanthine/uracil/vitamin C permease (AzgA family)
VFGGARFDVTLRTRTVLLSIGAGLLVAVGAGVGVLLDPSRRDLQAHFHIGEWGSRSSFYAWIHLLDAFGWLLAVCGVVVAVLLVAQRRKVAAAFPPE